MTSTSDVRPICLAASPHSFRDQSKSWYFLKTKHPRVHIGQR